MKDATIRKGFRRDCFGRTQSITAFEKEKATGLSRLFDESLKLPVNHSHYYEHGYRSGELHESNLWQIASGIDNARPFSLRETIDIPDFHIGLLVDCSGSMASSTSCFSSGGSRGYVVPAGHDEYPTVMTAARVLALAMGMSMSKREGLHLSICGHTEESGEVHLLMAKRPKTEFSIENFKGLTAQSGNLDGLATVAFAREMKKDMAPGETGMIVLISDGAPCHTEIVMKKAFHMCEKMYGLPVFPIGVADDLDDETCRRYYGAGNYVLAPDVLSSAPAIVTRANQMIAELRPM